MFANTSDDSDILIEAFNNSEIIICHESLIISNVSWKLIDGNLINNNIAGHLDIKNCVKGL